MHPLLAAAEVVQEYVSSHLGAPWRVESWTDLGDRSSHPAALLHGPGMSVFAKLANHADSVEQLRSELSGLETIRRCGARVPVPIGSGYLELDDGAGLMLSEALPETLPSDRTEADWRSIGEALALVHRVRGEEFGMASPTWFGSIPQANNPTTSWVTFYAERRLVPSLALAWDSGRLNLEVGTRVERLIRRLPDLAGPEPVPSLLHGDAQHHNFISTTAGAAIIDPCPFYGHPELDLALLDYFGPVPPETFAAYSEILPIAADFGERRELWRLFAYLCIIAVDDSTFARTFQQRLADALDLYQRG
jgi:fructosamine-3-kinase